MVTDIAIQPISKASASDLVVRQLLGFIKTGQLQPGDKLPPERDLAERFGISRPTAREALRALSVLGVIEIRHGGGAYVSALEATDLLGPLTFFLSLSNLSITKLYQARCLIEGEICALAAQHIKQAEAARLAELIKAQQGSDDNVDSYLSLDSEFHELLGLVAGNPFLARASQSLNVLGIEFRRVAARNAQVPLRSIRDHQAILAAIEAHDPDRARAAMVKHMDQVLKSTQELYGGRGD